MKSDLHCFINVRYIYVFYFKDMICVYAVGPLTHKPDILLDLFCEKTTSKMIYENIMHYRKKIFCIWVPGGMVILSLHFLGPKSYGIILVELFWLLMSSLLVVILNKSIATKLLWNFEIWILIFNFLAYEFMVIFGVHLNEEDVLLTIILIIQLLPFTATWLFLIMLDAAPMQFATGPFRIGFWFLSTVYFGTGFWLYSTIDPEDFKANHEINILNLRWDFLSIIKTACSTLSIFSAKNIFLVITQKNRFVLLQTSLSKTPIAVE